MQIRLNFQVSLFRSYSIHDIQHRNYLKVERYLLSHGKLNPRNTTLHIIPAWNREYEIDPNFQKWLHIKRNQGYKLFCHGLHHQRHHELSLSLLGKIINRITDQQAEFAGLNPADSRRLIIESLEHFELYGIGPADGFCPPTWWGAGALHDMVCESQISMLESRFAITYFQKSGNKKQYSFPVSYAQGNRFWFGFSKILGKIVWYTLPIPVREVHHPADWK